MFRKHFLVMLVALVAMGSFSRVCGESSELRTLTILYTNDMHAQLLPDDNGRGGWAGVAAYFKQVRKERGDVLILDAGDMTQGSPVSTVYDGKPIFEVMNAAGYDAATLGNHEFDNGPNLIAEFRKIASFPLLSANVLRGGELVADAPSRMFKINDIDIAVLGLTTSNAIQNKELLILPAEDVARKQVPELKGKAHLVIALTHLGVKRDLNLARQVEGIDVILGGHSHTALRTPLKAGETLVCQSGGQGRYVGELRLTIDLATRAIVKHEGRLLSIPRPGLKADSKTAEVVDRWEKKVASLVNVKIGRNPKRQQSSEFKENVERVWQQTYKTDFALQNNGGTRAALPEGDILIRHIYNIMPFQNTVVVLSLTRDQIAEEVGNVEFKADKPFYTLATNSYVANQMIGKYKLSGSRIKNTEIIWRDPVVEYIKKHGHMNPAAVKEAAALLK